MSLLEVILVAVYNHQLMLEGKLLLNNWVFPCQTGWVGTTLKRSHDSEMMKKMELGQVNENIFPQLDLNVFYKTSIGVRFPLANPSRFFDWNRWFWARWEWKKRFSSYAANKRTVLGISVMKCFPTKKTLKKPTSHIVEKFLSNAVVFLLCSASRIFFIPNLYWNELSPSPLLLTNIVTFTHWKEETAYCSCIYK